MVLNLHGNLKNFVFEIWEGLDNVYNAAGLTGSLGLYWMVYSIWPLGPSSMSVAPLFPQKPEKMVVPTGVSCEQTHIQTHTVTNRRVRERKIVRQLICQKAAREAILRLFEDYVQYRHDKSKTSMLSSCLLGVTQMILFLWLAENINIKGGGVFLMCSWSTETVITLRDGGKLLGSFRRLVFDPSSETFAHLSLTKVKSGLVLFLLVSMISLPSFKFFF